MTTTVLVALAGATGLGCGRRTELAGRDGAAVPATGAGGTSATAAGGARHLPKPARPVLPPLGPDEVYLYGAGTDTTATKKTVTEASRAGLLVVDLSDGWAPYIFQDGEPGGERVPDPTAAARGAPAPADAGIAATGQAGAGGGPAASPSASEESGGETEPSEPKPNGYRKTFVALANDRIDEDGRKLPKGEHNYLEPFGIPPTLSVMLARATEDGSPERLACRSAVDVESLRAWTGSVPYVDRERTKRDRADLQRDSEWLPQEIERRERARMEATAAAAEQGADSGLAGGAGGATATVGSAGPGPDHATGSTVARRAPDHATDRDGAGRGTSDRPAGKSRGKTASARTVRKPPAPPAPPPPATWPAGDGAAALAALESDVDPKVRARVERLKRGQERERAVRAAQTLLTCDGHLSPRARATPGSFDLVTHEALAAWERKNDVLGWGMLGGETQEGLLRDPLDLDYEAFTRVLGERVSDAAGIVEDGSTTGRDGKPARYTDANGVRQPVPNLIGDYTRTLLAAIHVADDGDMIAFLRQHGREGLASLKVAFAPPPLPPYYYPVPAPGGDQQLPQMQLSAEIDRGDVWYDFPFNAKGRPIEQPRKHFPHLTLFTHWRGQRIPLVTWRTTIGSWRSEMHANGHVYYKYKNSDVGKRVWKDIVAGPVWIPPDGTPVKDLLVKKVLERNKRPQTVVNTDVMGPGFQSAYGLVMAIHIDKNGRDNQIRTHGSVDYTSIARRFSHGCHRLVNDRAVRLFDFILRHSAFRRVGSMPLHMKRKFEVDGEKYAYGFSTRGYYYELANPVPVMVTEGRVVGAVKKPIVEFVRKEGVDYEGAEEDDSIGELEPVAADKGNGKGKGKAERSRGATLAVRRRADPSTGDAAASVKAVGGSRASTLGP